MEPVVYLNDRLLPVSEAGISVMDNGFLFGYGVFAGMRLYNRALFRLDSHLTRIQKYSDKLGIVINTKELSLPVFKTIQANDVLNGLVRITVSIGEGSLVPDPHSCLHPTVVISVTDYTPPGQDVYQKGYKAKISSICRHSGSPVSEMKTLNYLESMLARQEARAADCNEALLLNEKGYLSESASGNIFLVQNGVLKTPRENSGFIPGVVREAILEIAPKLDITAIEEDVKLEDAYQTDEAFLTNSLIEIMPLVSIDGRPVGSGKPGEITKKLIKAFRDTIDRELIIVDSHIKG